MRQTEWPRELPRTSPNECTCTNWQRSHPQAHMLEDECARGHNDAANGDACLWPKWPRQASSGPMPDLAANAANTANTREYTVASARRLRRTWSRQGTLLRTVDGGGSQEPPSSSAASRSGSRFGVVSVETLAAVLLIIGAGSPNRCQGLASSRDDKCSAFNSLTCGGRLWRRAAQQAL